jgi:hypothetical protein
MGAIRPPAQERSVWTLSRVSIELRERGRMNPCMKVAFGPSLGQERISQRAQPEQDARNSTNHRQPPHRPATCTTSQHLASTLGKGANRQVPRYSLEILFGDGGTVRLEGAGVNWKILLWIAPAVGSRNIVSVVIDIRAKAEQLRRHTDQLQKHEARISKLETASA